MEHIKGIERTQVILFPEMLDEYVEENNPVKFIDLFVDSLDLRELKFKHVYCKQTGRPPYHPSDLLKLYIYGYLNRIRSSRMLEKESKRNLELMWLLKKLTPDFKTIADFRKDNSQAIKKVFREFTFICKKLELFGGELVSIDGSKFKAMNSKKRNFTKSKLKKKLQEIEEKINKYFKELEDNDNRDENLNVQGLSTKIGQLNKRKEEYQKYLRELIESGETQISLTDPDSRSMVNNQSIDVCYNVQVTVDEKNKLILDHEVINEVTDHNQLSKMSKRAKDILEVDELEVLADKGYFNAVELKDCIDNGIIPYVPEPNPTVSKKINVPEPSFYKNKFGYDKEMDVYICPEGVELNFRNMATIHGKMTRLYKSSKCRQCHLKNKCTRNPRGRIIYRWVHEEIMEKMKIRVKNNKDKVKKRQCLSEHPFGTIKRSFNQGYMLMRGLRKVRAEISLSMLSYNIKRVINIVGIERLMASV